MPELTGSSATRSRVLLMVVVYGDAVGAVQEVRLAVTRPRRPVRSAAEHAGRQQHQQQHAEADPVGTNHAIGGGRRTAAARRSRRRRPRRPPRSRRRSPPRRCRPSRERPSARRARRANSAGIDRKKLSRVAVTRSRPRKRPAEIVAPDRETPGISANACTTPIDDRVAQRRGRARGAPGGPPARRTTARRSTRSARRATTHSERRAPVIRSLPSSPATPTGMVPTMTYQPIRWSSWPRHSGARGPGSRPGDAPDVTGEVDDHRGDRAHLDHGGVAGHRRVVDVEPEQLRGDGQVAGARDGQELGQPLDDTEHHGVEVVHATAAYGPRLIRTCTGCCPAESPAGRLPCASCSRGPWVAPA